AYPAIEIQAVVGGVLSNDDQLADAVGGQLAGLADDFLDRLGDVFAAHRRDGAKRAQPVAALGDFQVGIVPRRDPQPGGVLLGADWGRTEQAALFGDLLSRLASRSRPLDHLGNLFAAKDTHDVIDAGDFLEQFVLLSLGQTAGNHDSA